MQRQLTIILSVIWLSSVMTVMADEADWQYAVGVGMEAYQRGDYAEAASAFRFALKEAEEFGEEDLRLAASLNVLARLYLNQGRYDEAEPLFKRALAINEKALSRWHPDVAIDLNNLADLYRIQGRYDEAEPMFKRSLAIVENALGPEHPNTRVVLENLSALNQAQGPFGFLTRLLREYGLP